MGQSQTPKTIKGPLNILKTPEKSLKKKVEKAIDIVKNANWENEKVEMARYADYQFQIPSKNSDGSEDKIASYLLWISPNGENLEMVTDIDRYVKLTKQDLADLYEILTGEALMKYFNLFKYFFNR